MVFALLFLFDEVLIRWENLSKYVFLCRLWTQYAHWQTRGKGNEKKSNKCKMFQDSSIHSHFLRNFRAFGYQKYQNRMFNYEQIAQFAQIMAIPANFSIIEQFLPYFLLYIPSLALTIWCTILTLSQCYSNVYPLPTLRLCYKGICLSHGVYTV